jgi:hypothetical protein
MLWKDFENMLFVSMPQPDEAPAKTSFFIKRQEDQRTKVRTLLTENWGKKAIEILRPEVDKKNGKLDKFFDAVNTIMSNQVRDLVSRSIDEYVNYFMQYKKDYYPTPAEVAQRKFDADSPIEDCFLQLTLTYQGAVITFTDQIHNIRKDLVQVIEDTAKQSQGLPTPAKEIIKSPKAQLWEVPLEDETVKSASAKVEEIIEANITVVEKATALYDPFVFILKEKQQVEKFISENHTKEEYLKEVSKYMQTKEDMIAKFPTVIRMNIFMIICTDLNKSLRNECDNMIRMLLEAVDRQYIDLSCSNLNKSIDEIKDKIGARADTEEKLIEIEKYIEQLKVKEIFEKRDQYESILQWLKVLIDSQYKVTPERLHQIFSAHELVMSLEDIIEKDEAKLKNERTELENKLGRVKVELVHEIEEIFTNIEDLKKISDEKSCIATNELIKGYNVKFDELKTKAEDLKDKETKLGSEVSDFPRLKQAEANLKPLANIWGLCKDKMEKIDKWKNCPLEQLKKIKPDVIERETITLYKEIIGFKNQQAKLLLLAVRLAEGLAIGVGSFKQNLSLISYICNYISQTGMPRNCVYAQIR